MKFFLILFLLVVLAVSGLQVYRLFTQRAELSREINKIQAQASVLEVENEMLIKDINYFSRDENLAKELKSKFNYRAPDEKLIILVPRQEAGSQQP